MSTLPIVNDFPTAAPGSLGAVQLNGPRALLELYSESDRLSAQLLVYGISSKWLPVGDLLTVDGTGGDTVQARLKRSTRRIFDVEQTAYYLLWRTTAAGSASAQVADLGTGGGGGLLIQPIAAGNITLLAGQLVGFSVSGDTVNGVGAPITVELGAADVRNAWTVLITIAAVTTDSGAETHHAGAAGLFSVVSDGLGVVALQLATPVGDDEVNTLAGDGKAVPSVSIVNNKVVLTFTLGGDLGIRSYLSLGGNFDTVLQASPAGPGGNAITIATVADSGTKAGSLTKSGNAITLHYKDGVSTVADMEALFATPVSVTYGTVSVKTAGTGSTILAAPGDTHSATAMAFGDAPKPTSFNVSGIVTAARP